MVAAHASGMKQQKIMHHEGCTIKLLLLAQEGMLLLDRPRACAGPFCHRALLTLAEKHVPYKEEYIDFADKPKW